MGIFTAGQRLLAAQLNALANSAGINNALAATTTTSATYVNMPATSSFSYTKLHANTALKVELHITSQSTAVNTSFRFGVLINGVDTDVCQLTFNPANTHLQASGVARIAALAAGTYTVQGRMRVVAGGGTLTIATDDWLSLYVEEVQ